MIHIPACLCIMYSLFCVFGGESKIRCPQQGHAAIVNAIHGIHFVLLAALYEWFIFH